jgi:hypothetical protein
MKDRAIYLLAALLMATIAGPSTVYAGSFDTGYQYLGGGITPNACYFGRAQSVVPAADGMQVDIKAWLRKKVRVNGCSLSFADTTFFNQEGSVTAILWRASDFTLCTTTGEVRIPGNGYIYFGIGKTWNKSGACGATTTLFILDASGYYYSPGTRYTVSTNPNFSIP